MYHRRCVVFILPVSGLSRTSPWLCLVVYHAVRAPFRPTVVSASLGVVAICSKVLRQRFHLTCLSRPFSTRTSSEDNCMPAARGSTRLPQRPPAEKLENTRQWFPKEESHTSGEAARPNDNQVKPPNGVCFSRWLLRVVSVGSTPTYLQPEDSTAQDQPPRIPSAHNEARSNHDSMARPTGILRSQGLRRSPVKTLLCRGSSRAGRETCLEWCGTWTSPGRRKASGA